MASIHWRIKPKLSVTVGPSLIWPQTQKGGREGRMKGWREERGVWPHIFCQNSASEFAEEDLSEPNFYNLPYLKNILSCKGLHLYRQYLILG